MRGEAKARIDQALEYLVAHVYGDLDLIDTNYESDRDITEILSEGIQPDMQGRLPNSAAADKVAEYLDMQYYRNMPTSMGDIQNRYQGIPYGWREIDIAAVIAMLIRDQRVTVKYAGQVIKPDHKELVNYLRKKTEIGKTKIEKRRTVEAANLREVRAVLRELLDVMYVP